MNVLKQYQINTTGSSEGLEIPSGFIINLISTYVGQEDSKMYFTAIVNTYKNAAAKSPLPTNDNLLENGFNQTSNGNSKYYSITSLDDSINTIISNTFLKDLQTIYGKNNVVEL